MENTLMKLLKIVFNVMWIVKLVMEAKIIIVLLVRIKIQVKQQASVFVIYLTSIPELQLFNVVVLTIVQKLILIAYVMIDFMILKKALKLYVTRALIIAQVIVQCQILL